MKPAMEIEFVSAESPTTVTHREKLICKERTLHEGKG